VTCEQLYLPWLCPAYVQPRRASRRHVTIEAGSHKAPLRKQRDSRDGARFSPRRSLATAVDYRPIDDIPFEGLGQPSIPTYETSGYRGESLSYLKQWDPSRPVILKESSSLAPHRHRTVQAVGGELHEILSVLDACLQVGRIERAGVIIRRIATLRALNLDEMLRIHNQYLKISLENIQANPSESAAQALHKWFELEIRNKDIPMNAETIAYMLQASLQSLPGSRRDRLVRRYMDMVQGDTGLEVLGTGILTAEELAYITQITPTYNFPVGDDAWMDDMPELQNLETLTTDSPNVLPEEPKAVSEVRAVQQKGLGLKALKQALSLFSNKPSDFDSTTLDREAQRERQAQLEQDAVRSAIDRWRDESAELAKMGFDTSLQTKSVGARMWRWHGALESYLQEELVRIDEAESKTTRTAVENERCVYGPFLRLLPPDKLAAVTILACMTSLSASGIDKGMTLSNAIMVLGMSVEDECITEKIRKDYGKEVWQKLNGEKPGGLSRRLKNKQTRQIIAESLAKVISGSGAIDVEKQEVKWDPQWSASIKARVGAFLMSALIETAKVPVTRKHPETNEEVTQMQPAFTHAYQYKLGRRTGVVLANPALVEALQREPVHSLLAKHLPMVAEPEPWSQFNRGGFITHSAKVMRTKLGDKDQRNYAEAAILKGDMEQMFKGLDVLGRTSWQINQQVFDVMLDAWNSGLAIANFPPANPKLELPPEPETSTDPTERRRWIRAVKDIENLRGAYHSQRCFQNFQLEIARALRDEIFYFPHNVDFRGRAYPIPPYLNHMGADHCRGLLNFGRGKELGDHGLKWLKIHLANVFGYDKASLSEREAFAMDHLKDIYDSANNPLTGKRWWLKAEDPWQCLAACFELKNALDCPDPRKFASHLPIHQDGTCNGLQHYAALGGDEWGARQVNLEPGDRPADVYSAVANLVKESLEHDLKRGNPYAKILDGKITRKVVKQTVMTNVYGVTFVGAKAQVRKQLLAAHPDLPNTPEMNPGILSSYIATKIFKALSTMFRGAHDIQYWLGECASRISQALTPEQIDRIHDRISKTEGSQSSSVKSKADSFNIDEHLQFKSSVIWTNPLRMPVVQPYRTSKSRIIATNLQRISISDPHRSDPVSKRKQLQGFPPNFIHSLDATHMILSALRCDELGLSFAAVHDSFWTHATDIDAMNGVLRDAFIRIHSEDVIGRLAAEFAARYKGSVYLAKVRPGTLLSKKINKWREQNRQVKNGQDEGDDTVGAVKTLRRSRVRELLAERRRMRLLESSDPQEVAEGKKMVTPGSIFEEMAADTDLARSEELEALGLGEIDNHEAGSTMDRGLDQHNEIIDMSNVDGVHNPLPGGTAADAALCGDMEDIALSDKPEEIVSRPMGTFAETIIGKPRKHSRAKWEWAWLPLTFPSVPKKVCIYSFRYDLY
jgi:DNA-directed RNA polymerase